MFNGEVRRRRKVDLSGRSKLRSGAKDREGTLEEARRQRAERQVQRRKQQAATRIQAHARGHLARRRSRKRFREEWAEENGTLGERVGGGRGGAASALRKCVFFADGTYDDAVRLCRSCEAAQGLASSSDSQSIWLQESASGARGVHILCKKSVLACLRFLGAAPSIAGPGGARISAVIGLCAYVDRVLSWGAGLPPSGNPSAFQGLLSYLVAGGALGDVRRMLTSAMEARAELAGGRGDVPMSEAGGPAWPDAVESTALGLLEACLLAGVHGRGVLSVLALPRVWLTSERMLAMRPLVWKAASDVAERAEGTLGLAEEYSSAECLNMLHNLLAIPGDELKRSQSHGPLVMLLAELLESAWREMDRLLDPGSMEEAHGAAEPTRADAQEALAAITGARLWGDAVVRVLPDEGEAAGARAPLALASVLHQLVSRCSRSAKESQTLLVLFTRLAFSAGLLERLARLLLSGAAEGAQGAMLVSLVCTVHTWRLQIIHDADFYQLAAGKSSELLNGLVTHVKTFLHGMIRRKEVTLEDLKLEASPGSKAQLFCQVVDYLTKLHEQNGRHRVVHEPCFHFPMTVDDKFLQELDKEGEASLMVAHCAFAIPFFQRAGIFRHLLERDREEQCRVGPNGLAIHPLMDTVNATIRRSYVLEDGFAKLGGVGAGIKRVVRIQYVNEHGETEAGVDGGGLFKDFLEDLLRAAFDTQYGFFRANPENKLYPNPSSQLVVADHLDYFQFFGRMIGKAMYEGILVEVPFAEFFLTKLRGKSSGFSDLPSFDKELYDNLCFLRGYKGDVEDLGLYFAIERDDFGQKRLEELIPDGKDVAVTSENSLKYINLVAHFKLNVQLRRQFQAFISGFHDVIKQDWIAMFNDAELQELISGSGKRLDLDDMKAHMHYSGGYDAAHPVIRNFWEVLQGFGPEEQGLVLKFVTSCSRPPLLGFRYLDPKLCIQKVPGEVEKGGVSRLPTASTCMNLLKLPAYESRQELESKLRYAITAGAGFDLS